jgi:hypothetical protein
VPFQVANCTTLGFAPDFKASTAGRTSRLNGASLSVKLLYPHAKLGSQANIKSVKVELPKQLPSRLTTLHKACLASVFEANRANCPRESVVGHARVITPVLPVPLEGPAYFVSHGNEAFPSLTIVLQGYGVTVQLVGTTFIKNGVTSSTFKTTPDVPINSFELTLPQGPFSALGAISDLCQRARTVTVTRRVAVRRRGRTVHVLRRVKSLVPASLPMPTSFVAQNGAELHRTTNIAITGCAVAKHRKVTTASRGSKRRHA